MPGFPQSLDMVIAEEDSIPAVPDPPAHRLLASEQVMAATGRDGGGKKVGKAVSARESGSQRVPQQRGQSENRSPNSGADLRDYSQSAH